MLIAALMSRSWRVEQLEQVQDLISRAASGRGSPPPA
ncbi:hypothetical protein AVDCRST_MAG81-4555, partial [uncultured Synechococcales cyanobacterium]